MHGILPKSVDYKEIEDIFLNPVYTKDFDLSFGKPNKEKIEEFLVEEYDFSIDRVKNTLEKLIGKMDEKGSQSRLGDWG